MPGLSHPQHQCSEEQVVPNISSTADGNSSEFSPTGSRAKMLVNLFLREMSVWSEPPPYGGPQVSRHNLLSYGTTYFLTAQLTFSRHNLLSHDTTYFLHGTIYFLTAQLTFSRHNLLSNDTTYFLHGTIYFLTAQLTFSRQKLLFYCKNYFFTGHGTIYFLKEQLTFSQRKSIFAAEVQGIRAKKTNPHSAGFPAKIVFVFYHGF